MLYATPHATALAALTILASTLASTLASPLAQPSKPPVAQPRTAVAARELHGTGYRPLDARELAELRKGAPAASIGIDLPLHGAVTIDLVRTAVATPDFTLEVASMAKGKVVSQQVQAALPNAYRGTVEGFPDSLVYIGVGTGSADGLVAGYVEIGDETWWLSSGPDRARRAGLPAMIAHSSALAGQSVAGLACAAPTLAGNEWNPPADGGVAGGAGCREFRIAVDTDTEFTMSAQGGDTVAASQYALLLLGGTSQIYDRDFNAKIPVSYLRLWTGDDPWVQTDMGAQLNEYQSYWNANMGFVARDLGHYLAGRGLGGGVAWLSVVCSNQTYGYGLSSGIGYGFPYPLVDHDYGNWEPMVVAHEIGHNFGAPHTHDYTPPADGCGLGDCSQASTGTIMSYCHGCDGGMSNVSLHFHPMSIASIQGFLASVACNDAGARAVNDSTSTLEGTEVIIEPLANDAFVNCTPVTISYFAPTSAHGGTIAAVAGAPSKLRYTPPANFNGSDSFIYSVSDGLGHSSNATVYASVRRIFDRTYLENPSAGAFAQWYALAGDTAVLPDFSTLTPYGNATLANIDIASTGGNFSSSGRADLVAAAFSGYLSIPATGLWTFSSESDDGSRMLIDGQVVVTNDGLHGMVDRSGQIALEAGYHTYRVEFFENFGGAGEIVRWEGPGVARATIPASAYVKGGTVMQIDLNGDGDVGAPDLAILLGSWGPAAPGTPADFDRNGLVNAGDLARLLALWGT